MQFKTYNFFYCLLLFLCFGLSLPLYPQEGKNTTKYLVSINVESPRACLKSFLTSMNAYKEAIKNKNYKKAEEKIQRALQTLDLSKIPTLVRIENGKEAAIYLKETIDRIFVPKYSEIPDIEFDSNKRGIWHVANTRITISRMELGDYLFSSKTVQQASNFYKKVRHLPYLPNSGFGSHYQETWWNWQLPSWLQYSFLTLSWWQWMAIFLAILLGLIFKTILRFFFNLILKKLEKLNKLGEDLIQFGFNIVRPITLLFNVGFWFLCLIPLQLKGTSLAVFHTFLQIHLSICLIWLAYQSVGYLSDYLRHFAFKTDSKLDDQIAPLFERSLKVFTIIAGTLLAIQNLGINVASLLAGLGLGGLAVALAARDTVANLFGSLMIIFDRPFQIGDWVKVNDVEGNVEDIGFRSTRIRTFYNSLISIPNSVIASTQIDNMGAREYRRIRTNLNVCYDTPPEKVEKFINGIKQIIEQHSYTRKDKYYIYFKDYAESSLDILLYFFLKVNNWQEELEERQNIFLKIYKLAKTLNVEFAFPTRTLHIQNQA